MKALTARHRVNGLETPLGIEDLTPRFSWHGLGQPVGAEFEIEVSTSEEFEARAVVWTDSTLRNPETGVVYAGDPLNPQTRYWWRVRAVDQARTSAWSEPLWFETGLRAASTWSAKWITSAPLDKRDTSTLYFRTAVDLPAPVVKARVYASALGWYRLFVNGVDLTGHSLVPRWTSFDKVVEYQVYDATAAFHSGDNVVGMVVSEGRFRGRVGGAYETRIYGDHLSAIAHIELELADGTTTTILTDEKWRVGTGRIVRSDPMAGERVDMRISGDNWLRVDGDVENAMPAIPSPELPGQLIAEEVNRVAQIGHLAGTLRRTPSGAQLIDFGQVFAGVAKVRLSGPTGTTVRISYSEVLRPDGELDTEYLGFNPNRSKKDWFQRDEVILDGQVTDYTPWFTIHGFRYVAVEGLETVLQVEDVSGIVLSTDIRAISEFKAADTQLEQLWRNVTWSLRSNFTDTPTDCPTRERSGWTGDIQVFSPTAIQLVDSEAFLRRYLRNLSLDQHADGTIPVVIPSEAVKGRARGAFSFARTSVGWGDASVVIPWVLYKYLGDHGVLERQYQSAAAWVDNMEMRARTRRRRYRRVGRRLDHAREQYILDHGYNWGEWLRPGEKFAASVAKNFLGQPVVATAYFAFSARLLSRTAEVLGKDEDAVRYGQLAKNACAAWRDAFVSDGGARIGDDKQDEYVRALAFDLLLPEQRASATRRLVELIEKADFHLATGFLSTHMILDVLADEGRADIAFRLLLQQTGPSWLNQIDQGATTIWENWEGYKPNGRATASHNHYALGAVAAFLQERVGGLSPAEPGYKRLRIAPLITGELSSASIRLETPFGVASSAWVLAGTDVELTVDVPDGSTADVEVGDLRRELGSGHHVLTTTLTAGRLVGSR
ncbi:family 78 glycoside hydrolase catalytic domain [Paenarthrobacter nicotinovorans]|uniref:family 78 glycoside hydrolase catalytic domain n=1 Tax=Paenarthrobacter nicotinovorans TaxID=29320 RepID=UPI003748C2DA